MFIKSITIDGFKSYAQRTEVDRFDPYFNAITGLNGSGKSNILDSICFLLGITNLQQVRATNLQELVYKNGQAGITKATVSITFDNNDKSTSPMGMEAHNEIVITRQIVIGGRNKYLINGVNAQNSRVADVFRSVGLNVNNPHFLIMQGRVTKVMNMKPPEILSMIEEATGTSMYEAKKDSAQRMIEKKENKLNQINQTLQEEITPTLQRLREERTVYLEFQKLQRELDRLTRVLIAYKFKSINEDAESANEKVASLEAEKEKVTKKLNDLMQKREEVLAKQAEIEKTLDNASGGELKSLEDTVGEMQKLEAKAQSTLAHEKAQLKSENKRLTNLRNSEKDCQNMIKKKKQMVERQIKVENDLHEEFEKQQSLYERTQKQIQAIQAGLAIADDGEEASWKAQLLQTVNDISDLKSNIKQSQLKLTHLTKEKKSKTSMLKNTTSSYKRDEVHLTEAKKKLEGLVSQRNALNFEENSVENLITQKRTFEQKIYDARRSVQNVYRMFPQLEFEYVDPERGFNRSKVKGLVAELIEIPDLKNATALETVAGGRLYNVVADSNDTVKQLLKNGQLKRRITFLPLNKIKGYLLDSQKVSTAKSLVGGGNVDLALALVNGDNDIQTALQYVFGSTLVCDTMENAQKIAFHPQVKAKTVTLGGEVYDPAGTLTGGSSSRRESVLSELSKYRDDMQREDQYKRELKNVEILLVKTKKIAEKYHELTDQIGIKEHEIDGLESKLSNSSHAVLMSEVQSMEEEIQMLTQSVDDMKQQLEDLNVRHVDLKKKVEDAPAERNRQMAKAEADLKKASVAAEKSREKWYAAQENLNTTQLELDELGTEATEYAGKISSCETAIAGISQKVDDLTEVFNKACADVKEVENKLNKQREYIKNKTEESKNNDRALSAIKEQSNECNEKFESIEQDIGKINQESSNAKATAREMLSTYNWIETDQHMFGQSGSPYDFEANSPKESSKRCSKIKEKLDTLQKSVNMRALTLLGQAEEKYNELLKKKRIIENDKAKIQRTIEELDQKKNEAVTKAYVDVNKNFGNIFSTLLPGATAKLSPLAGQSVLAGLEFHVGFGDVWKTNLNELSGGQRSLVALSLILALLLLKPAPLYILDEVDAALDLSHTQNIGTMLRNHFKKSQFIVVSLKDGMFNNANVLFRTKFVDGVSTVTRYAQAAMQGDENKKRKRKHA